MSDLVLPTREQIDTLSPDLFHQLLSNVLKVQRARFPRGPHKNSAASRIARLAVGESALFSEWPGSWRLNGTVKLYARRTLKDPTAQWAARTTNQGVRVTRIR